MAFKMRNEPIKPKISYETKYIPLHEGISLEEILKMCSDYGENNYKNIIFDIDHCKGDDNWGCELECKFYIHISNEAELSKQIELYEKELEEYKIWTINNEENIKQYLAEQEETKRLKIEQNIKEEKLAEAQRLKKAIEELQAKYAKVAHIENII